MHLRTRTKNRRQSRRRRRRSLSRSRSRKMLGAAESRRRRPSSGRRVVVSGGEFGALAAATAAGLVGLGAAAAAWKARAAQKQQQQQEPLAIEQPSPSPPSPSPPSRPRHPELDERIKEMLDLAKDVYIRITGHITKTIRGNTDQLINENATHALEKIKALNNKVVAALDVQKSHTDEEKKELISNILLCTENMQHVQDEFNKKHGVLKRFQAIISVLTTYQKMNNAVNPKNEDLGTALDEAITFANATYSEKTTTQEQLEKLLKKYNDVQSLRNKSFF